MSILFLAFFLFSACLPVQPVKPVPKEPVSLSEPQRLLESAQQMRKANDLEQARSYYQQVVSYHANKGGVAPEYLKESCYALMELQSYERALEACQASVNVGAVEPSILETVKQGLRQEYGRSIEASLIDGKSVGVRTKLDAYKALPGAKLERVADWEKRLVAVERAEQKKRDQEEKERKRAAAEAERQHQEKIKRARQRLIEKWGMVKLFSATEFQTWILLHETVLGQQFFSNVEIEKPSLALWVDDPDRLANYSNLRFFADIADAFVVWCDCDGETTVGVDMSYMRGGKMRVYRYRFNPEVGQSQLSR
jgi:hypothetical protein